MYGLGSSYLMLLITQLNTQPRCMAMWLAGGAPRSAVTNTQQHMPSMQLFQDETPTPATAPAGTPAGRLALGSVASPAAQAILGAIGGSSQAAAQQQVRVQE